MAKLNLCIMVHVEDTFHYNQGLAAQYARLGTILGNRGAWWIAAGEGVLAEAAACGVPILAQNFVRGTPATRCVIDGFNGFLHHDAGALARLYPNVLSTDRLALHRHAWARMAPRRVAEDRLERMQRAIAEIRAAVD